MTFLASVLSLLLGLALLVALAAGCFFLFASTSALEKWAKWKNEPLKIKTKISDAGVTLVRIIGLALVFASVYFGYTVLFK